MASKRERAKGRKESGSFVLIPHSILRSDEYAQLSAIAVKLLLDMFAQYNGRNNGDLCCAWKLMAKRGWKSRDTLFKAQYELETNGWIERTRQGRKGTPNMPNLFAVAWLGVDDCRDKEGKYKLEVKPNVVASNKWKNNSDTRIPCKAHTCTV